MTRQELQDIFRQGFNNETWQQLLISLFGATEVRSTPAELEGDNNKYLKGMQLGEIRTSDRYTIGLFAFEVGDETRIEMNRVGLRSLVGSYTKYQYDAALSIYYNNLQWRLSFICDLKGENTAPKRYTYVFGNRGESYRTAAERLIKLSGTTPTFESIKEAFSVEQLSKDFFKEYKRQYIKFIAYIGDTKSNRDYVKKMLGRLVFLQFLQKKGWMGVPASSLSWEGGDTQYLQNLIVRYEGCDRLLSDVLEVLFFDTLNTKREGDVASMVLGDKVKIPYLNGGLFDSDALDDMDINFPYGYFEELMEFFSHYNFTIDENDPYDAEVGVDPEMLGHIFENLLEDNKDKGAFYTPKEIVQYMCRQSLIEYLQSKLGKHTAIEMFVNRKDVSDKFIIDNAREIERLLDSIKICDPAIGSGAFPMGILNEIFHCKMALDLTLDRAEVKKAIIQNSIYGVDIEQGAVDIARLRFWLSLVVEENEPQALPNLDYKIMCGNSLLSRYALDVPIDEVFAEYNKGKTKEECFTLEDYKSLVAEYTNTSNKEQKDSFRAKIEEIKSAFKTSLNKDELQKRKKLEGKIEGLKGADLFGAATKENIKEAKELEKKLQVMLQNEEDIQSNRLYENAFEWRFEFPALLGEEGEFVGFDVVIGNPPYVSTKGITANDKTNLIDMYGFADDLYYHFIVRGFELLCNRGIITMITPDTYFTTLSKKGLRTLLIENKIHSLVHLGHDVFNEAMVSTAIFVSENKKSSDEIIAIIDARGKSKITEALSYTLSKTKYLCSINGSLFVPNPINLKLHTTLSNIHHSLISKYWSKIETAREISKNSAELGKYRESLKEGDWTLIGLVTEGGQGLATANNGKYVGVRKGTKEAIRIAQTRIKKLAEVNKLYGLDHCLPNDEQELWSLFETIKKKYGRDVFGQGYLYKIVPDNLIADVEYLSDDERKNGIINEATFVPYDKGDKDGNRWYLDTPYLIDWSKSNVFFLKSNSGKKGSGMPVVRNQNFYFREGFCYSDIKTFFIRCRLKGRSIHDVKSMSLFPIVDTLPYYYIISIINSRVIAQIINSFMNNTPSFQINDCRSIPIPVPSAEILSFIKSCFDRAVAIQKEYFAKIITVTERDKQLEDIQAQIDEMVYELYGLTEEEVRNICI